MGGLKPHLSAKLNLWADAVYMLISLFSNIALSRLSLMI